MVLDQASEELRVFSEYVTVAPITLYNNDVITGRRVFGVVQSMWDCW